MPRRGEPCPKPVKAGSTTRSNKARAYAMERREAAKLTAAGIPASRVPLSGALKGVGLDGDIDIGDVVLGLLGEAKSYTPCNDVTGTYLKVYLKWITKIMEEAELSGKWGFVVMQAKGSDKAYVVFDRDAFYGLLGHVYRLLKGQEVEL